MLAGLFDYVSQDVENREKVSKGERQRRGIVIRTRGK